MINRIRTILIVDDDAEDRRFFSDAVKDFDIEINCIEASNGEKGLLLLSGDNAPLPDCIFLDLRMPRLNGKEFLQQLKAQENLKHIPVYIYTTSRDLKESEELRNGGALHFISKPNSEEEVYYLIACALEELNTTINTPG